MAFPVFKLLLRSFRFAINGASPAQLKEIEILINSYRIQMNKVNEDKKTLDDVDKRPKLSQSIPVPKVVKSGPIKTPWKAEVHIMIKRDNSAYFPHTIWFDTKNRQLH